MAETVPSPEPEAPPPAEPASPEPAADEDAWWLPSNPGGLVYGTILVAALMAAENPRYVNYPRTAGGLVVTLFGYWLAVSYSQFTGGRVRSGESFRLSDLRHAAAHELAVVEGALVPVAALLICWAAGARLGTGITVAIWTAVGMILVTEVLIGIRAHLSGPQLMIQTGLGALLGVLVLLMRLLLH